ncbi:MAG: hypothetical protein JWR50_4008 [Mucilaginibacter sp.]|nr:hypothetical protein [Mucilaginibacter sp.]
MKKTFTKVFSAVLVSATMLAGLTAEAQQTTLASANTDKKAEVKADSTITTTTTVKPAAKQDAAAWVPTRRLWGYAFGDLYFAQHADGANRGPETQYNGTPANRNAFQFRRLYLGYDYDINQKFSAEVLLASEPNANTGVNGTTNIQNGDNLVDGKMAFWIKNFNIRVREIWKGTDLVVGEMSTPGFALNTGNSNAPTSLSEATWGYRFIEKTLTDFHKNNSYDVGAALQGTFDPSTKNFGYVFMVGNNSQSNLLAASNPSTGFYKIFYGDLWGKFLDKKLYVDIYADYVQTGAGTATIGETAHNMEKIFVAYNTKPITVGAEIYTQMFKNGVTSAAHGTQNANALGMSFWAKGTINAQWGWFGRYDNYNPYTNFDSAVATYTPNTTYGNYTPLYKETFVTAGLDFQPAPKIHFSPNVWLVQFKDQRAATTTGHLGDGHDLVYRATFYYTFGK